jgi:hypothetical protein
MTTGQAEQIATYRPWQESQREKTAAKAFSFR